MSARLSHPSIVLAYQRDGFPLVGGIRRVAEGVCRELHQRGAIVHTWQAGPNTKGLLPQTMSCRRLRPDQTLVVLGCDKPWAYGLVIWRRLRRPGSVVAWLPSFHDPRSALHPLKARIAALALRLLQHLGVVVFVQTAHELQLLDAGRCHLSSHSLSPTLRGQLMANTPPKASPRDVHLAFLGRPTTQKGWPQFLQLVKNSGLRAVALLPTPAEATAHLPENLQVVVGSDDDTIQLWLRRSRLLALPATYESLGLAQLEALAEGCLVPVLGHWPFFPPHSELDWQGLKPEDLSERCRAICHNEPLRLKLVNEQRAAISSLPLWDLPVLPGLISSFAASGPDS